MHGKAKINKYLILIVLLAILGCEDNAPDSSAGDLESIFEQFWTDFDQNYSYFEVKQVDWDSVYAVNRPRIINGETTSAQLESILSQMAISLKDLHVSLATNARFHRFQSGSFTANSPENAINYLSQILFNTNTLTIGSVDSTNIQYVRVKNLSNDGDFQPFNVLISELPQRDGLVIDLRDNGGGNDGIALNFVNNLASIGGTFELVRFRNGPGRNDFGDWFSRIIIPENEVGFEKPIAVLTNRNVVSSAESFVNMLNILPNVTLLGDTTRGSSGNPGQFSLSNGWTYRISRWQAATPDTVLIEDRGIAPDVVVNNTRESINNGKDLILERAIELLTE